MNKETERRLAALENGATSDQGRVTRIELVDAITGEVGGVIHVGGKPDQEGVMQALEYKHETDPPRKLIARKS